MRRSSCLVLILMVFSQILSAGFHEPVEGVAFHDGQSSRSDLTDPRKLIEVGVLSGANAVYELAVQRAQLRRGQAKGLIDKINRKLRSVVGLPPKPEPLVAGRFLENDLTAAEQEALKDNERSFMHDTVDIKAVSTKEKISKEAVRIEILKARLNSVLADKANYSDLKHIAVLIEEVDGLYKILSEAIEKEAADFSAQYPDVTRDKAYEENVKYLTAIEQGLGALKKIQEAQKEISRLTLTWFSNYVGTFIFGTEKEQANSLGKQGVFKNLSSYLFADSRAQDSPLQPWQVLLETAVRKQVFELCKPILLKEYAPKSPAMKANVSKFLKSYRTYQARPSAQTLIKAQADLKEIIDPAIILLPSLLFPNKTQPIYTPVDTVSTVDSLQKMSDLLTTGKNKQPIEVAFARLLRPPFSSSEKERIDHALDTPGSLSLEKTVAFKKASGTLVASLGKLDDSIKDSKGDQAIAAEVASVSAVAQQSLVDLQTLFEQQGIAHEMTFVLSYYKTALKAADDEYQGLHDASKYLEAVLYARSVFESAYKEAVQEPAVEFVLWKNRLQQLIDSRIQALKLVEVPVFEPVVPPPGALDIPIHSVVMEKQQELALAKQKQDVKDRAKQQEVQTALAPLQLQEKADSITAAVTSFQELLKKDPFSAQDLKAVVARYEQVSLVIDQFVISDRQKFNAIKEQYSNSDHAAGAAFSPYVSLFNRTGLALNQYSAVVRELQKVQQFFDDIQSVLRINETVSKSSAKQFLSTSDLQELERYSNSSNTQFKGLSEYVSKNAKDLVEEIKQKGLYPKKPEPVVKPLPVDRPVLTDEDVAQRMSLLEGVDVKITKYKDDFDEQVAKINELLAKDSLQEVDIENLLKEYKTLQNGLNQYWDLSSEFHSVLTGGLDQLLGGLGSKQAELSTKLRGLYSAYSEKVFDLQRLGIGKLNDVTETFAAAQKVLGVEEQSSLVQRQGLVGKALKLSPDLVSKLCELVFFEAPSSLLVQNGVRKAAMEYLGRGLPKNQIDDMKNFYSDLVAYRQTVSELVVSKDPQDIEQLENALKALKAKVKLSKIPQRFKTLISLRIIDELRKFDRVSFPVEYIKESIEDLEEQLLEVVAGKMSVADFRLKNSLVVKGLLAKSANTNETDGQLRKIKDFIDGRLQPYSVESVFFNAIVALENARSSINFIGTKTETALKGVATALTNDPEIKSRFQFDPSVLGPVLRLLFFDKSEYLWAQDSIQNQAVVLLQEAVSKEGLLADEDRRVFEKVLVDYQTFKKGHDQIQAAVRAREITVSQQAVLNELERSMPPFLKSFPTEYPGERYAESQNEKLPEGQKIIPVSDYVETGFRNKVQDALRADIKKLAEIETKIAAGGIKVVPDPVIAPTGSEDEDHPDSDNDSFYSAQEPPIEGAGKSTRDEEFEEALPEVIQKQVALAMESIKELKVLAAQFSVHAQSVDSIGLAEEGLAIVTEFEASMPKNILDHDSGALRRHIDALKLLFNDAMNNQKLAVVASLQALRASVAGEFGSKVFPPLTADFQAEVKRILTPVFADSLSKDSAFKKFLEQELVNVNSVMGTKAFFALLDQVHDALKQKEEGYAQEIGNLQDQDAVDALALYPKRGVLAATDVLIPKLEDAYRLALFETLTSTQQNAFKAHNSELYEQLAREFALKKESEGFKKQGKILQKQFEDYLLDVYKVDFDKITTVQQVQELLQGDERFGGVEKQLATYETFMGILRSSNNVELAFELYEQLTPFYKKLKGVEEVFMLLKKDKITDLITFKTKFKFYSENPVQYSSPSFHGNSTVLQKFFINPLVYLSTQAREAEGKITSLTQVDGVENLSELLLEAQDLKRRSEEKTIFPVQLELLKARVESLEGVYNNIKNAYGERNAAVDSALQLGTPNDVPLSFEKDLQSPEGRQQAVEFIAQALSLPGSVLLPPSILFSEKLLAQCLGVSDPVPPATLFSACRETLHKRIIATGKRKGVAMDKRYRDLEIILRNDLLWSIELEKLQGRSVLIPKKIKNEMVEWANSVQVVFAPEPAEMDSINSALGAIKAELASKVAVKK